MEGARQAVDQIIRAIRYHEVVNGKGDLPAGYTQGGTHTVPGIGKVSSQRLLNVTADAKQVAELREAAEKLVAFWSAVSTTHDPVRRAELIQRHGADLVLGSNRYASMMEALGLRGPYG